jgi:signal transduction histidine kinase
MRRLYLKIYLTIVASLVLVVLITGAMWRFGSGDSDSPAEQTLAMVGELASFALPPAAAPAEAQQRAVAELAQRLKSDLALFSQTGAPIAAAGRRLPPPPRDGEGGWMRGPGGPAWSLRLPDRRWVVVRAPRPIRHPALGLILFLCGVALAVAIGAYPVVRGLTRRLERLQTGVETLGAGNLSARVSVEGRDEVARLAESFNRSAERIEDLVGAHRMLLANASHELRTPLSRIRLGLELWQETKDPAYKTEIERNIAELDGMIDEILLASRLGASPKLHLEEGIDLLALAAEEAARCDGCSVGGEPVAVRGDRRLLGRMVRNLIENATRHGRPPVEIAVRRDGATALLEVTDCGDGVPETEREKVFQPFHRLRGDGKGAGLGLALVRQIARLHGGDAAVAPRPDRPACFRVTVPAV